MRKGLTETEVDAAVGDLDHPGAAALLGERTITALRLVDLFAAPRPQVSEADYTQLRASFEAGEILELAAAIAVASGWQRMIEAFGIRPDHWSEATPLPWRGGDATAGEGRR